MANQQHNAITGTDLHAVERRYAGNPNGNLSGILGQYCQDTNTGDVYRSTGGTAWEKIIDSSSLQEIPAGSDTQVQYNDAGELGGATGLTYTKATSTTTAVNLSVTGNTTIGNAPSDSFIAKAKVLEIADGITQEADRASIILTTYSSSALTDADITLIAPITGDDRTITLPDATGTLAYFASAGTNNQVVTSTGDQGLISQANLTFDGSTLAVTGAITANTLNTGHGANELYPMDQPVRTIDSPSFVALTLTQASGTAPMTISSTTVVTNLNADLWDGYQFADYLNQPVRTGDTPSFTRLTISQTTGTAPMTISSTTVVSNLNSDLWDGYQFADYLNQPVRTADSPSFYGLTVGQGTVSSKSSQINLKTYDNDLTNTINFIIKSPDNAVTSNANRTLTLPDADGTFAYFTSAGSNNQLVTSNNDYGLISQANLTFNGTILSAPRLTLTQTTGTAPMTITSTTVVTNLNADLLDGQHGSYYLDYANFTGTAPTNAAGSDGQVQYNNGGVLGGASALYYDDVNNNVGIGTTPSASYKLDVSGNQLIRGDLTLNKSSAGTAQYIYNENGGSDLILYTNSGKVQVNDDFDVTGTGSFTGVLSAPRLTLTQTTGTAPMTISSTTVVTNLNADLLDGLQSTNFLRSDTDDSVSSYTNQITFPSNTVLETSSGDQSSLQVYQATAGNDAFMAFHVDGDVAAYFGLKGDINDFAVGGWSMGANYYRVWHAGSDGSGSGLDADLLDGQHGSYYRLYANLTDDQPAQGTDMAIQYNDGLFMAGSSNFVYDYTTGRVGIGTAIPASTLDVTGQTQTRTLYLKTGGGTATGFLGGRSDWTGGATDNNFAIGTYQPNICFFTNNSVTERMRIDSSGRLVFNPASISDNNNSIFANSNGYMYMEGGTNGLILANNSGSDCRIRIEDNNTMQFQTSSTERMRIASDGDVKIGSGDPAAGYKLDVDGSQLIRGDIKLNKSSAGTAHYIYNENGGSDLVLYTNSGKVTVDDDFYVSGNAGIGTTPSGSYKLEVNGKVRFIDPNSPSASDGVIARMLHFSSNPYGILFRGYNSGVHSIQVQRESNNAELFDLSLQPLGGNVGIGTTTPRSGEGTPLTIESSTGYVGISLSGTGSYANVWQLYASGDGGSNKFFGIYDRTNNAYRLVTTSSGYVGIGTTNPQNKLHVGGATSAGSWMSGLFTDGLGVAANGTRSAVYLYTDNSTIWGINGYDYATNTYKPVSVGWGGSQNVYLARDGGNVGIGTTNANANLHIVGSGGARKTMLQMSSAGTSDEGLFINTLGTGNDYYAIKVSTGATSNAFALTNAGNVGIGTTGPSSKLEVSDSSSSTAIRVTTTAGTGNRYSQLQFMDGTTQGMQMYQNHNGGTLIIRNNTSTGSIAFLTNDTDTRMIISSGGTVAIDTALPNTSYKFHLGGGNGLVENNFDVVGTLSKGGGSFRIPHPDPAKPTMELWHSFIEAPTAGENLYRWQVGVKDGIATILLPDYYKHLNENHQVWVSPVKHFGQAYGEVTENEEYLVINANADGLYNVLLIGTRKDPVAKKAWKGAERDGDLDYIRAAKNYNSKQ